MSVAEFLAYRRAKRKALAQLDTRRKSTSRIVRDPEVAAFVEAALKRGLTYGGVRAECLAQFGQARTPSAGSIGRYSLWLRAGPSSVLQISPNPT
jgi:hypothetical protein